MNAQKSRVKSSKKKNNVVYIKLCSPFRKRFTKNDRLSPVVSITPGHRHRDSLWYLRFRSAHWENARENARPRETMLSTVCVAPFPSSSRSPPFATLFPILSFHLGLSSAPDVSPLCCERRSLPSPSRNAVLSFFLPDDPVPRRGRPRWEAQTRREHGREGKKERERERKGKKQTVGATKDYDGKRHDDGAAECQRTRGYIAGLPCAVVSLRSTGKYLQL